MNQWTTILRSGELKEYFRKMADLDPITARASIEFYESRTPLQLLTLMAQAKHIPDAEAYMLARSFYSMRGYA